jgi:uncharacterized protein (DUF1501 family)
MKRRDFIKTLPIGAAAASVPLVFPGFTATGYARNPLLDALLNPQSASDDRVLVLINLSGGNDGINTCIPFGNDIYYQKRPSIGWTNADKSNLLPYQIRTGMMALNPQLNKIKPLWDSGKFAVAERRLCRWQSLPFPLNRYLEYGQRFEYYRFNRLGRQIFGRAESQLSAWRR